MAKLASPFERSDQSAVSLRRKKWDETESGPCLCCFSSIARFDNSSVLVTNGILRAIHRKPNAANTSKYLTAFAAHHGVTKEAVEMLIRWAVVRAGRWVQSRVNFAFRTKACAWEVGFIRERDLPYCVAIASPTIDFLDFKPRKSRKRVYTIDDL